MPGVGYNWDSTNIVSKEGGAVVDEKKDDHGAFSTNAGGSPRGGGGGGGGGAPVQDPTLLLQNTQVGPHPSTVVNNGPVVQGSANHAQVGNSSGSSSTESVYGLKAAGQPGAGALVANTILGSVMMNNHYDSHYHYGSVVGGGDEASPAAPVPKRRKTSPDVLDLLCKLGDLIRNSPDPKPLLTLVSDWLTGVGASVTLAGGGGGEGSNANPVNTSQCQNCEKIRNRP